MRFALLSALLILTAVSAPAQDPVGDLRQSAAKIEKDDREYLHGLAADTWRCIDSLTEPDTGLPYDSSRRSAHTSISNIGLYLTAVVAARDLGFVDPSNAQRRVTKTIRTLRLLKTWQGFPTTWNDVHTMRPIQDEREHTVSLVDAGNLMAGIITVSRAFPAVAKDCEELLAAMDVAYFYDARTGRLRGGYDTTAETFMPNWWITDLASDSRMISFLALGKGVPASSWESLKAEPTTSHGATFFMPGWKGGGLFMQYLAGMWIHERGMPAGNSAAAFAFDQIAHRNDKNLRAWGWSACDSPHDGYVNAYGMTTIDTIVAPYASILAIEDYPASVVGNLRTLELLGARDTKDRLGFYDGFDLKSGESSKSFLMMDQSMILISLCNYLASGRIRTYFGVHGVVRQAYLTITSGKR